MVEGKKSTTVANRLKVFTNPEQKGIIGASN